GVWPLAGAEVWRSCAPNPPAARTGSGPALRPSTGLHSAAWCGVADKAVRPVHEFGIGFIRALEELGDGPRRVRSFPHCVVPQDKKAGFLDPRRALRAAKHAVATAWLGVAVGKERRERHPLVAGPKTGSDLLGVLRVAHDRPGPRWRRRRAPREAGGGQVEGAPEEVDRGALAPEAGPVPLHDDVDPREDLPEPP